MGSRNNGERMSESSYLVGVGSGLTFWLRQRETESGGEEGGRDKEEMRVFEEVRKNKSTEKDESTSGTRQGVDVYHFTQVANVAVLSSPPFSLR